MSFTRRDFIGGMSACAALASIDTANAQQRHDISNNAEHKILPPWEEGTLELHHIATGRGNATFIVAPDGTTMLIDAGAIYDPLLYTIAPRPDGLRRPGEWISRYISRRLATHHSNGIDYALLTHFHGDHIGQSVPGLPLSRRGNFQLTGIIDVAESIDIAMLIDRGFPEYAYPMPLTDPTTQNYRAFVADRLKAGRMMSTLEVGSSEQIVLRHRRDAYPQFKVENMAANGFVASKAGTHPISVFPKLDSLTADQLPSENMCSQAVKIAYGPFSYYSGGDLTNDTDFGKAPWRDIETPVAKAVGPVTVAVANHHGYVNGMGPDAVGALQPQAFVVFAWDSAHPTISPLFNMLSRDIYPGERRVYGTSVKPENVIATRDIAKMTSTEGHIVVRVSSGGADFEILVVGNDDETDRVKSRQGPFRSIGG
jgi:hypothetical protein